MDLLSPVVLQEREREGKRTRQPRQLWEGSGWQGHLTHAESLDAPARNSVSNILHENCMFPLVWRCRRALSHLITMTIK